MDGLEMLRYLPAFNEWHDAPNSSHSYGVSEKAIQDMRRSILEMGIPNRMFDSMVKQANNGYNFLGLVKGGDWQVREWAEAFIDTVASRPTTKTRKHRKNFLNAAADMMVEIPPIKFQLRYRTDWANSSFRRGSSCWWSSSYKNNFTPGKDGIRNGFGILFAMPNEMAQNNISGYRSARSLAGKMLPEGMGPLGRAWVYPAEGGLIVINTYDSFRNDDRFNDERVAGFLAAVLNSYAGELKKPKFQSSSAQHPRSINVMEGVHVNNSRFGQVFVKNASGNDTPYDKRRQRENNGERYKISMYHSGNWVLMGRGQAVLADGPVQPTRYNLMDYGSNRQLFFPVHPSFEYYTNSPANQGAINAKLMYSDIVVDVRPSTPSVTAGSIYPKCLLQPLDKYPNGWDDIIDMRNKIKQTPMIKIAKRAVTLFNGKLESAGINSKVNSLSLDQMPTNQGQATKIAHLFVSRGRLAADDLTALKMCGFFIESVVEAVEGVLKDQEDAEKAKKKTTIKRKTRSKSTTDLKRKSTKTKARRKKSTA